MPLILLASYPKSGNTWMRALLTNYLSGSAEPASINALVGFDLYSRWRFDELTGLSSSIMTDAEFLSCRSRYFAVRAAEADGDAPVFVKTHEPQLRLPGGDLLFPEGAAAMPEAHWPGGAEFRIRAAERTGEAQRVCRKGAGLA